MIGVDVTTLYPAHLTLRRQGQFLCGPCPMPNCGGRDRFVIRPERTKWFCRGCTPTYEDGATLIMRLHNVGFLEACRILDVRPEDRPNKPEWKPPAVSLKTAILPDLPRSARWSKYVDQCRRTLWSPDGAKALAWLKSRGLQDDTIKKAWLGYDLYKSERRCITIPWRFEDRITTVKKRFAEGPVKYGQVTGGVSILYIAREWTPNQAVVLTEGEQDALYVGQCADALCGVATMGSAGAPVTEQAAKYLEMAGRIFIMADADEAGDKMVKRLQAVWPHAIPVPNLIGNDPTEGAALGANIRNQLASVILPDGHPAVEAMRLFPGSQIQEVNQR